MITTRTTVRLAVSFVCAGLLAACGGGGHFTPVTQQPPILAPAQQDTIGGGIQTMSMAEPAQTSFLPSSWGKIGTFQIFDETKNGTISEASAEAHGDRYNAVWGARPGMGAAWRASNAGLQSSYYFISMTDASTSAWGGIGHSLAWWQANHPTWVLYACTSTGTPTHTPAGIGGLSNVPLDIRNSSVVSYQIRSVVGPYAKAHGYNALAADEVTFWFAGSGGSGYYPCGIWSGRNVHPALHRQNRPVVYNRHAQLGEKRPLDLAHVFPGHEADRQSSRRRDEFVRGNAARQCGRGFGRDRIYRLRQISQYPISPWKSRGCDTRSNTVLRS